MRLILLFLDKLSNYGIKDDTTQSESRHIQFSNYCSIISIFAILVFCTFDSIIAFQKLKQPIFISLAYIPLLLLTIYLNKKYHYTISRHLLTFSCISLTFIVGAFYFGRDAGEHNLFILFAGIALIVNPISNWKTIISVGLICALSFLYIEFFADSDSVLTPFPSENVRTYRLFTSLFAFFTFIFILVIYEIRITQKEDQIELNFRNLEEINKGLLQINEEVRMNHDLLVRMNTSKNELFSIIAHDLRSPIGNILASSEILSRSIRENDRKTTETFMNCILESSQNTFALLEDLLVWSRAQINHIILKQTTFEIEKAFDVLLGLFQSNIERKELKVEIINPGLVVYTDYNILSTILRNIFSNTVKFSYPGGLIQMVAKDMADSYEIQIKDFGVGISSKKLEEIMSNEKVISSPGTLDEKGTGFGLSICRELVAKLEGRITIESTLGKGSTFTISLPKKSQ